MERFIGGIIFSAITHYQSALNQFDNRIRAPKYKANTYYQRGKLDNYFQTYDIEEDSKLVAYLSAWWKDISARLKKCSGFQVRDIGIIKFAPCNNRRTNKVILRFNLICNNNRVSLITISNATVNSKSQLSNKMTNLPNMNPILDQLYNHMSQSPNGQQIGTIHQGTSLNQIPNLHLPRFFLFSAN